MMSNSEKILQLIKQGEGLELEFKEARTRLNRDVFETACAFMNRIGGPYWLVSAIKAKSRASTRSTRPR